MATYSKTVGDSLGFTHTVIVTTASQSVANNTSTVNIVYKMTKNNLGTSYATVPWSVTVNGTTYSGNVSFSMTQGQTLTILAKSQTISHDSDGTKSFSLSSHFDGIPGSSYCPACDISGSYTLARIPRKSSFTIPTFTAGSSGTISISRASSSFTHTVTYSFGTASGTIASKTTSTSVSWTPPLSLLQQIPNATSGTGTMWVETFSGSTSLGRNSKTLTIKAGSGAIPSAGAITVSEGNSTVASLFGPSSGVKFLEDVSSAVVNVASTSGYYGSTVKSISVTLDGQSSALNGTSGNLTVPVTVSGSRTATVKVTDSRGRYHTYTTGIEVLPYTPPALTSVTVNRCNAAGTPVNEGTHVLTTVASGVQSITPDGSTELNTQTLTISWAPHGSSTYTTDGTYNPGISQSAAYTTNKSDFLVSKSWDILVSVSDKFASTMRLLTVSTASVLMHWDGGSGLGVGKYRQQGMLDVAGDGFFSGNVNAAGIVSATTATVGSLDSSGYISTKAAHGGTAEPFNPTRLVLESKGFSIPSGVSYTVVSGWSTVSQNGWSVSGSNITCTQTGLYIISIRASWSSTAAGSNRQVYLRTPGGYNLMGQTATSADTSGIGFQQAATWVLLMTAGDVVGVYGRQMSGSNLSAEFGFAAVRIA